MSSETKHTPYTAEPWIISERYTARGGPTFTPTLLGKSGKAQRSENFKEQEANVARAAQCVNACRGMSDPAKEIAELRACRDELATIIKLWEGEVLYRASSVPALERARAALKARGE